MSDLLNKLPFVGIQLPTDEQVINSIGGLRDKMAMAALQGILSHEGWSPGMEFSAYGIADAMLEARRVTK